MNKLMVAAAVACAMAFGAKAETYYMIGGGDNSWERTPTSFASSTAGAAWGWNTDPSATTALGHSVSSDNDYVLGDGQTLRPANTSVATPETFAGRSLILQTGGSFTLKANDLGSANYTENDRRWLTFPLIVGKGGFVQTTASDARPYGLRGAIEIDEGDTLIIKDFLASDATNARFRSLTVESTVTGAGDLEIQLGAESGNNRKSDPKLSVLTLAGDMSEFTGRIVGVTPANVPNAGYTLTISGPFGGTIASLPDSIADKTIIKVDHSKLVDGATAGLRFSSTAIPARVKDSVTFYGIENAEEANIALMSFPEGTLVEPNEFTVKCAATASDIATAFASLGTQTVNGRAILIANPRSEGLPADPPIVRTGLYWTGEDQVGVLGGEHYTLSGVTNAVEPGTYTAYAQLEEGYYWKDGTLDQSRRIDWTIDPFEQKDYGSTFLNNLAASAKRIRPPSCASGGDIILQDGDDYIHVFIDATQAATFTPGESVMARVLAIGGGGAGGLVGGGGGAGGMLDLPAVAFIAGTSYSVTVGAGGVWPKDWKNDDGKITRDSGQKGWNSAQSARFSGKDSMISNATESVVRAYGGGGGGSCGNKGGVTGGSGGGGAGGSGGAGGLTRDGQGNNGGSASTSTNGGAGGGGAGAAGTDTASGNANGGAGGAGKSSDILGFDQIFAGGGGGGCQPSYTSGGSGGAGGGGAGATVYNQNNAKSGTNGLGGGGGASGGQSSNVWAYMPGDGGDGIVVIRYTDPAKASTAPAISMTSVTTNGDATATIAWTLMGSGSITVNAVFGCDAGNLSITNELETGAMAGDGSAALSGLLPGRTYSVAIFAENEKGETSTLTAATTFTMPADGPMPETPTAEMPVIAAPVIRDRTGGPTVYVDVSLDRAGAASAFADCTATVRWGTVNDLSMMTSSTSLPVGDDGKVTLVPYGLGTADYYGCVEAVNAEGHLDRVYIAFKAGDDSVYRWKEGVTEGEWKDPANWTGAPNGWGLGYPTDLAKADFTSVLCATVHVSGVIRCVACGKEREGGEYVFIGDTDDAAILAPSVYLYKGLRGNQLVVFDNVDTWLAAGFMDPYCVTAGDKLILKNGSQATVCRDGDANTPTCISVSGAGARLELHDRSALSLRNYSSSASGFGEIMLADNSRIVNISDMRFSGGFVTTVDNSTFGFLNKPTISGGTEEAPTTFVLKGAAPRLEAGEFVAKDGAISVICELPATGWAVAPFSSTSGNVFPGGEGSMTFTVPRSAPVRASGDTKNTESAIVSWSAGIDANRVVFGRTAKGSDYFYFTDEGGNAYKSVTEIPAETVVTGVRYHHEPSAGTVLIVW